MAGFPTIWTEFDRGFQPTSLRPLLRQIDDIFSDLFPAPEAAASEQSPNRTLTPQLNVHETAENYLLSVDLPGVAKEDLNIEVLAGRLVISGERKNQRMTSTFQRSIGLPEGIQGDQLEAHYKDGVLSIAVPKPTSLKATKVKVGEGRPGFFKSLLGDKSKESQDSGSESVKLAN